MKKKPIFTDSDWNIETIEKLHNACAEIASQELGLDTYPNQFEIISSAQMLDAYASIGMPVSYQHWSYGKVFVAEEQKYRSGKSGLAYELVINSNPCINYLMEENSATVQALVIAHAGFGHNHFFKNNYMFKEWTHAEAIIDYLLFAKEYINKCEEKYGYDEVEKIIDSAHALRTQGVDRYKRPSKLNAQEEKKRRDEIDSYMQQQYNPIFDKTIKKQEAPAEVKGFPLEPEENILKFIEKYSPSLAPWQREIIRIVRMISQYFYPQRQTKVMNEGFACWTHMYIMHRLHEKGLITEGSMLEFMAIHSNVVYQPSWAQAGAYFNPYTLGLSIFRDIERICKDPTPEDIEWFPEIAGKGNHIAVIKDAVANYRDESFIRQFLSPKLMRDFRMFQIGDEDDDYYLVRHIHNDAGYKQIRKTLAEQYEVSRIDPNIQVVAANLSSTRLLELEHYAVDGQSLIEEDVQKCLQHLRRLWGYHVRITSTGLPNNSSTSFEVY